MCMCASVCVCAYLSFVGLVACITNGSLGEASTTLERSPGTFIGKLVH